ncbi:hypothetical protein [Okeania sp. KiyG1]|uniref:hypothetical protein n=1 Tax=Okeania sp. KiyG1 TaxID=2720165 RepID=UPI00192495B1|nr:hypothetical protein [Okeania sp. KiyG1]
MASQGAEVTKESRRSTLKKKCFLLMSANDSYHRAEEDTKTLTGIEVNRRRPWFVVLGKRPTFCRDVYLFGE